MVGILKKMIIDMIDNEDFSVLENEWIDFVAEMFYMTFISKEEN